MSDRVRQYYDDNVQMEWDRLARNRMEFALTMRTLKDYLPDGILNIIEVGCGPGRYTLALAEQGHQMTAVDLAPNNIRFLQQRAADMGLTLTAAVVANALDLNLIGDGIYDAALLLGPLYHLQHESERRQAVQQVRKKVRAGGIVAAAFITRFAAFRDAAANYPEELPQDSAVFQRIIATGRHDRDRFPHSYFAHPDEIVPLMESCNLETLDLVGVEGLVSQLEGKLNELDEELYQSWVEIMYQMGKEPSVHGASDHLVYVGRVP